jgi:type I restriction enzyme S subunit
VNEEARNENPGDTPYYGANGLQGFIDGYLFDEDLILLAEDGGYFDEYETRPVAYRISGKSWVNNHAHILRPKRGFDFNFVFYSLQHKNNMPFIKGGTRAKLNQKELREIRLFAPIDNDKRAKIGVILSSIDSTIEKTEALVGKYQQVKAGLMRDLFTRGIGKDGKLRPPRSEAPDLYKQTPIGWLPKEWEPYPVDEIKESLIDGPFGSNLKTAHYVESAGVHVVRLQNIQTTMYDDNDKAFISESHAKFLIRNQVIAGDVLIAGLGEERYPVGRACIYPEEYPPAINKADCFRLRCDSAKASNKYSMYALNTSPARQQVRRYEQGVTRPRINLGNIRRIVLPVPGPAEQEQIVVKLDQISGMIITESEIRTKLQKQNRPSAGECRSAGSGPCLNMPKSSSRSSASLRRSAGRQSIRAPTFRPIPPKACAEVSAK